MRRVALVAVLAWAVAVVVLVVGGAADVQRGRSAAEAARGRLAPDALRDGRTEQALEVAERRFERGRRRLGHPVVAPLRLVPFAGRQLRSATALAAAAEQVSGAALVAVRSVRPVLDDPGAGGAGRLAAVEAIARVADRTVVDLSDVELGPAEGLLGPLHDARAEVDAELEEAVGAARRLATASGGLAEFLRGPRRYLLLAANNAEMRSGSGMFLSAGVLEVRGGELALGAVEPTGTLTLEGDGVPATGDLGALWGWTEPGQDFRDLGLSPRFAPNAELAAQMWAARGEAPVDGVLVLDVRAIRGLLAATGPVDIGDETIGEGEVERLLLRDQYLGLGYETRQQARQDARRDRLGEIARAVVAALQKGDVDLAVLARELGGAAAGRHVLVWGSQPLEQEAWTAAGVDGAVGPASLLLGVLNRGGNKLDPFLDVEAGLEAVDRQDGTIGVTVRVAVENTTPEGEAPYVAGPHPDEPDVPEGAYVGLVALTMPADATDIALGTGGAPQVIGRDGASQVVATNVRALRGEQWRQTISFVLPATTAAAVRIEAGARLPATLWSFGGRRWRDDRSRMVDLGR